MITSDILPTMYVTFEHALCFTLFRVGSDPTKLCELQEQSPHLYANHHSL
jgi:hypothetical protein